MEAIAENVPALRTLVLNDCLYGHGSSRKRAEKYSIYSYHNHFSSPTTAVPYRSASLYDYHEISTPKKAGTHERVSLHYLVSIREEGRVLREHQALRSCSLRRRKLALVRKVTWRYAQSSRANHFTYGCLRVAPIRSTFYLQLSEKPEKLG